MLLYMAWASKVIKRGWRDAVAVFGGWQAVIPLLIIPPVGFLLHLQFGRPQAVQNELFIWAIYGLAASGVVFILIFVGSVISAPYRIERDRANTEKSRADAANAEVKKLIRSLEKPDVNVIIPDEALKLISDHNRKPYLLAFSAEQIVCDLNYEPYLDGVVSVENNDTTLRIEGAVGITSSDVGNAQVFVLRNETKIWEGNVHIYEEDIEHSKHFLIMDVPGNGEFRYSVKCFQAGATLRIAGGHESWIEITAI